MNDAPSTKPGPSSINLPGPADLRYYPAHRLVAWQPQGVLDDRLLDQIAEWIVIIEKTSNPFNRFVDFTRLTGIAIRSRHVFDFARKRAEEFRGLTPVRTALFSDDWVGFGMARLYESLMAETPIQARAFRDRRAAAIWLDVPVEVLGLEDQPAPRP